ncbi:MAG: ATP-dependent DNA helicase, partial [Comamonadaceae bacterium]
PEGVAGHSLVQARRGPGFEAEVSLTSRCLGLRVRGRANGYDAGRRRIEEIKTFRGRLDAMRANHRALHWAQARTYGWMLCERDALPAITVALVYLDLASGEETVLEAVCSRDALQQEFEALCATFVQWAAQEAGHRSTLHAELDVLAFPHPSFRAGQRELASGVYRAAAAQRCLVAQAPTGIGKTIATTYPLLRAWPGRGTDKIFFLTAKTSGRAVALEAFGRIGRGCASLRVLELSAREKVCEYPGRACNGDACPLARGFFDRLPAARSEAVALQRLDRAALRRVGLAHAVCPYYLAQEMVRWSDVVVADFNLYFDSSAMLFALTRQEEWKVAVLVDEAHNLLDRARSMYTATLDPAALDRVQASAPRAVRPALAAVRREWQTVQDRQAARHATADAVPDRFYRALQAAVTALADHFGTVPEAAHGPLQQLFFDLLFFVRLCDAFGDHSVFESVLADDGLPGTLTLRNLVPGP